MTNGASAAARPKSAHSAESALIRTRVRSGPSASAVAQRPIDCSTSASGASITASTVNGSAAPARESLTYSAAFVVCAGRDDAEVGRRAAAIGREVDELRSASPLVGTPTEIVDKLGPFAEAGVQRAYLQLLDMSDLDHLELFASEVIPALD